MANIRENQKRSRMQKLTEIIIKAKKEEVVIDKPKLCSIMMVEHCISKKTAMEEITAIMDYEF